MSPVEEGIETTAPCPWGCRRSTAALAAKIELQRAAARHYQRQGAGAAGATLRTLRAALEQCRAAPGLDALRGVEGSASAAWFELLGRLLRPPWVFTQRRRRPPPDPVNALLSLGYTFLHGRTLARCEAAGLEVALGTLHAYRPGRPSLACDLMEPLRVPAVDRWVLELCNQRHLTPDDFRPAARGGVELQPEAFRHTLWRWEESWHEGGLEAQLDQRLDGLTVAIRRYAGQLPTPSGGLSEAGDPGNGASD